LHSRCLRSSSLCTDLATPQIYTLSLTRRSSDLDQCLEGGSRAVLGLQCPETFDHPGQDYHGKERDVLGGGQRRAVAVGRHPVRLDRKSTRLNSSHSQISYAVFCLKKKKNNKKKP